MTVRLTPTESDTTPPPPAPAPPAAGGACDLGPDIGGPDAPVPPAPPAGGAVDDLPPAPVDGPSRSDVDGGGDIGPGAEGRRALREARRQRRRTAWLCVAVVALCLALTIVVVTLARYRPVTPPGPVGAASGAVPTIVHRAAPAVGILLTSATSHGATAPEGGNP